MLLVSAACDVYISGRNLVPVQQVREKYQIHQSILITHRFTVLGPNLGCGVGQHGRVAPREHDGESVKSSP